MVERVAKLWPMDLRQLFAVISPQEKLVLADKADTDILYLYQLHGGPRNRPNRRPSVSLCRRLVEADSRLTLHELRPDIWQPADEAA